MGRMTPFEALQQYTKPLGREPSAISPDARKVLNQLIANHDDNIRETAAELVTSDPDRCVSLLGLMKSIPLAGGMNYTPEVLIDKMEELLKTATNRIF